MDEVKEFYENNEDFKTYVDKYAAKHEISVDEALKHNIVLAYYQVCRKDQ